MNGIIGLLCLIVAGHEWDRGDRVLPVLLGVCALCAYGLMIFDLVELLS